MNTPDMKHHYRPAVRLAGTVALALMSATAFAASNIGVGDIAGDDAALVDSDSFSLLSTGAALKLVKTAYIGTTELTSGATLAAGTKVKFLIYLNNNGSVAVNDITISDTLDALFVYDAGTLKVDSSVANCAAVTCTDVEEAAIFAAVDDNTPLSDAAASGDVGSLNGTTLYAGNRVDTANDQLNAPANTVVAVSFTVTMQ